MSFARVFLLRSYFSIKEKLCINVLYLLLSILKASIILE